MAVEKMVEGRLRKYFEEVALMEQKFIVNDSINIKVMCIASYYLLNGKGYEIFSKKVYDIPQTLVDNLSKEVGSPVKVADFLRVEVGEGIER